MCTFNSLKYFIGCHELLRASFTIYINGYIKENAVRQVTPQGMHDKKGWNKVISRVWIRQKMRMGVKLLKRYLLIACKTSEKLFVC